MVETPDVIPVLFLGLNVFENLFCTTKTVADIDGEIFMYFFSLISGVDSVSKLYPLSHELCVFKFYILIKAIQKVIFVKNLREN